MRAGMGGLAGCWRWLDKAGPAVVGNCAHHASACVYVSARGGVDLIPTGRGCMSCNTRERRLNFVVPLGRMDGTNCLSRLTLIALTRELTLEGFSRTHAHAQFQPAPRSDDVCELGGLDLTTLR